MTFEAFWESYPRKVGKGYAKKCYEKAVKAHGAATILDALKRFNQGIPPGCDMQFLPHPSTWLNQARFLDPPKEERVIHNGREDITKRWVRGRSYTYVDALGFRQQKRSGGRLSADEEEAMRLWNLK